MLFCEAGVVKGKPAGTLGSAGLVSQLRSELAARHLRLQACFISLEDLYEGFDVFWPFLEYKIWLKLALMTAHQYFESALLNEVSSVMGLHQRASIHVVSFYKTHFVFLGQRQEGRSCLLLSTLILEFSCLCVYLC